MKKYFTSDYELEKFDNISDDWWDIMGNMKMLHYINPLRISFILRHINNNFIKINKEISILDFGCGAGLLTENLKRLQFDVMGVDGNESLIQMAREESKKSKLNTHFEKFTIDELNILDKKFDVIIASEVLEHLNCAQIEKFFYFCKTNLNDDGLVVISTINKTISSLLFAKFAAEYILKWVPPKTHDWKNFLKPFELNKIAKNCNLKLLDLKGMNLNLIKREWIISDSIKMNYLMCWKKLSHTQSVHDKISIK